jgi:hypothetical protein
MKRARFTEEQIIGILKEAETAGNIRAVCREHNLTEQTFYRSPASKECPEVGPDPLARFLVDRRRTYRTFRCGNAASSSYVLPAVAGGVS